MLLLKNRFIKSFILCFCFICLFIVNIPPQRASANPAIIIGGLELGSEALVAIGAVSLYAGGATLDYANGTDSKLLQKFGEDLVATGQVAQYLSIQANEAGQQFLTWTADGLSWFNTKISDFVTSNKIPVAQTSFSTSITIPKTSSFSSPVFFGPSFTLYPNKSVKFSSPAASDIYVNTSSVVETVSLCGYYFSTLGKYDFGFAVNGSPAYTREYVWSGLSNVNVTLPSDSVCFYPVSSGVKKYSNTLNQDVIGGTSSVGSLGVPLTSNPDGSISVPTVPSGSIWQSISSDFTYVPSVDVPVDVPTDGTIDVSTGVMNIPILGDILRLLQKILDFLGTLIASLVTALTTLLKTLFIPTDTFFADQFNKIKGPLIDRIGYQQYIDAFSGFSADGLQDISVTIMGHNVVIIKLTVFEKFRGLVNAAAYGFMFFGLAYYNYSQVYRLIRGNSYGKMAQTIDRMKGE